MALTIDGQANSITSSTAGVNIPATVDTLSVGPSGSYMIANSSGVGIGTLTPQTTTHILGQNPVLKLQGTASTSGISGVELHANNNRWRIRADNNTSQNYFVIEDYAGGSNTNRLLIDSAGRVTMPYQPAFLAYRNTALSVTTTWQNISSGMITESYDVGSVYSTSTNGRFVAPVAGKYMFYAGGYSGGNTSGERYGFGVKINNIGSPDFITGGNYCTGDTPLAPYQVVLNLATNDYIELWFFSAISTTIGGPTHVLYWGGYLLG